MAVQDPPLYLQSDAHPAKHFRQLISSVFGISLSTSHVGGVIGTDDFKVTERGTPNMSVDVAKGHMLIPGTEALDQGSYLVTNGATVNVAIATSDPTNPRKDIVYVQVRDAGGGYSGSDNDCRIAVATGTPAASPADPSLPVNAFPLARVDVPANDTAITDSQITSLRRYASALGGIVRCTSTTRPTGVALYEGLIIAETDTDRIYIYDGTNWIRLTHYSAAGRTGGTWRRVANQSVNSASQQTIAWDTEDFDSDGFLTPTSGTITIPANLGGVYVFTAMISGAIGAGRAFLEFAYTGALGIVQQRFYIDANEDRFHMSNVVYLNAGDTAIVTVFHSTGSAVNFTGTLWMGRLTP